MANKTAAIEAQLGSYDPTVDRYAIDKGVEERKEILGRFPRESWSDLELTRYAVGQENSDDTYCRYVEFASPNLGSIKGGSSKKLLIFKYAQEPGWYYDKSAFSSVEEAWEAVRAAFVKAFDLAVAGDFEAIDDIPELQPGRALLNKSLHIYFPEEILPIGASSHLQHFLGLFGHDDAELSSLSAVRLNRMLLEELQKVDSRGLSTNQLERILYRYFAPPSTTSWWKIAPGAGARYWEQFLEKEICAVGWVEMGDLTKFTSNEEYYEAYAQAYGGDGKSPGALKAKANELWRFYELKAGDRIIANKGKSEILGLGEVVEPYFYDPENEPYHHVVRVKWDQSYAMSVPFQGGWSKTIDKVKNEVRELVKNQGGSEVTEPPDIDPLYLKMEKTLTSKGQLILQGPPGTGKTFHARRFAAWFLLNRADVPKAESVFESQQALAEVEQRFSRESVQGNTWVLVASPKQDWTWDELFDKKTAKFKAGLLKRNFPKVRVGDLVFGYTSTPTKRIEAIARITRELGTEPGDEKSTIEIEPVARVGNGPTFQELKEDPILKTSEPLNNTFQGTLFSLTSDEAEHLMEMVTEQSEIISENGQTKALSHGEASGQWNFVTFHPSYAYEDFVEGFRPAIGPAGNASLELDDGVFKQLCLAARANPDTPYVLIIDEINRANLSKVFGELFTLLEKDKRGLSLTLPQSKESFEIPRNVYLVGTMNTADRSIAPIDLALRRRFAFLEVNPDSEVLDQTVGALSLAMFLEGLNQAIAEVVGQEKQIGHSFFLDGDKPIANPDDFHDIFVQEILPLLQEYCFGEMESLLTILGSELVDPDSLEFKDGALQDPDALLLALATRFSASSVDSGE